jgi:Flp pilus assembly protein TadD
MALPGLLFLTACSRQGAKAPEPRIAILRFENLGDDPAFDWIGRGLSELVTAQLTGQRDRWAISVGTLHAAGRAAGPRPNLAPGVSAESSLALLAGANLVGYGDFAVRGGRLEARLFLESLPARKYTQVITASAGAADVIAVANSLARQIAPNAAPSGVHSNAAMRDYVNAIENQVPGDGMRDAAAAIAADPGFAPAYRLLAEWKAEQRDTAGALALLDQAVRRVSSPLELARIHLQSAVLRHDAAGRRKALTELAAADPGNPEQWNALAEAQFAAHDDAAAAAAFRKELELAPDNRNSLNLLGYASANAGNLPGAVSALRHYQAIAPDDPNPLDSLGDVHLATGHLREAEQFYLAAYQKNPKFLDGADLFKAAMARLMTGDIPGATEIHQRYLQALAQVPGRTVEIERAEWQWATGRRKEAYQQILGFAQAQETGAKRDVAARGYAELAMWSLLLGDRAAAAEMAHKALGLPGGPASAAALVAQFLAQPPASAAEWEARAGQRFPNPALEPLRDPAILCALLLNGEYQPASALLRKFYDEGPRTAIDEGIPVMLAWTLLESGHAPDAAPLLRLNPIPPATGFTVFTSYYFPRLYYLRGLAAAQSGKPQEAREAYQLFLKLSGPDPLAWGEERKAMEAISH